jgi:fumarate reductase flavoprotein subunit
LSSSIDTDAVVVGAGLAGMTAANRLLQAGLKVLVLEAGKDERYLCNSRIASGSFNLAHSDPTSDADTLFEAILGDTEGAADKAQARAIAETIGEAFKWFREEGAKFVKITRPGKAAANWSMAPPRPAKPGFGWEGRGPDQALSALERNFLKRGGSFSFDTRAQDLVIENGACVGVKALRAGEPIEIRARHVLLADGGFQGNPDLVRRFISPKPDALVSRNAKTGRGDALLMAEKIGAKLVGMDRFYGHLLVQEALTNNVLWPYPTIDTLASSAIVVGRDGKRFIDEGSGGVAMTNVIAGFDDPLSATAIFDQAIWDGPGKLEFTPPNPHLVASGGTLTTADTLTELAAKLGLPVDALVKTVQDYNRAIESGTVDQLSPPRAPGRMFGVLRSSSTRTQVMPIRQSPFHAIKLAPGLTYTMGGIAIDGEARVLGLTDQPIVGLYAAGACTGGLEGGPMAGYVGGLCKALSLGFIAARTIAAQTPAQANRNVG